VLIVLLQILNWLVNIVVFAIVGRAILSWFVRDPSHPVMRLLIDITEPILGPIRRALPKSWVIDLSPLIAILVVQVLWSLVRSLALG
jgi:YggT family protein